ncbi:MAG: hypothetical protein KDB79_04965 [Acidobacteria bacterium]|nr:hypothetical protein [Acidobacteriota bacterium]
MKKPLYLLAVIAMSISFANIFAGTGGRVSAGIEAMNFEIPFAFNVGEKSFPAGEYKVEIDPTSSLLILTYGDNQPDQMIGEIKSGKQTKNDENKLVFYQYGDEHFLREVDAPSHTSNLRKSDSEKQADKRMPDGTKLKKVVLKE